ncbi:MAG TPA: DUF885 domain-containing protein [Candidatus Sulfotelmatobacter sp.]|nr:DUF885 domain-containing protein [Candidatus Sulfotelmatobacter sp.]
MLETEKAFASLSEEFVEVSLRQDPVAATLAGIHDYDALFPDHSPDGQRERSAWLRDFEQRLVAAVPWEELPTTQRVDFALLRSKLAVARAELEDLKVLARNPVRAAETALYGVFLLMARPFAPLEERKEPLLSRLMALPDYLEGARTSLQQVPPLYLSVAIEVASSGPSFVDEVVRQLLHAFPGEAERIEHAGGRARVGFLGYQEALERDVRARAGGSHSLGQRWLDWRLEHEHLLSLRSADLDALGREHMATTLEELENEARRLDPSHTWQEQIAIARERHPETLRVREAYVAEVERARRFVAEKRLAPLPEARLEIVDTPVFERPTTPYAAYLAPAPFDEESTGWFFVTPVDMAKSRETQERQLQAHALAALPITTAHEAYPGHHLQVSIANRSGSRLRKLADSPMMCEGWALYSEELMYEHGFYREPVSRLYQLRELLRRACRVVIDVGLHTGRMSFEQAVQYLVTEALVEPEMAESEVKRYALTPTQPSSYLVGKIQLTELRDEARRRLGSRFDLHDFHAALLASGSVPPTLVREELSERLP